MGTINTDKTEYIVDGDACRGLNISKGVVKGVNFVNIYRR